MRSDSIRLHGLRLARRRFRLARSSALLPLLFAAGAASAQVADAVLEGDALENARQLHLQLQGGWAWQAEDCAIDPIRISSSDDGRLMFHDTEGGLISDNTIPASKRFTYRVLDSSGPRLRLALEGEVRTDASGKPVQWDLVMTDPDHFCWRQLDWPADRCTQSLVRCPAAVAER
jgi:hypothetical protein